MRICEYVRLNAFPTFRLQSFGSFRFSQHTTSDMNYKYLSAPPMIIVLLTEYVWAHIHSHEHMSTHSLTHSHTPCVQYGPAIIVRNDLLARKIPNRVQCCLNIVVVHIVGAASECESHMCEQSTSKRYDEINVKWILRQKNFILIAYN